jgi:hypothetical protein
MKIINKLAIFTFILTLYGCPNSKFKYYDAYFPQQPQNLTDVNSEFDDYNSALPESHFWKKLIFSSNRNSKGNDFDIYDGNFHAVWYMESGVLSVENKNDQYLNYIFHSKEILRKVEKEGNQFAPYAVGFDSLIDDNFNRINVLLYSTQDSLGLYKSEFVYYVTPDGGVSYDVYGPVSVPFLKSSLKQRYISFFGEDMSSIDTWELKPNNFSEIYFDETDEKGNSDIFKILMPDTLGFLKFLSSDIEYTKINCNNLNSTYDDRCPFINGKYMVFASNRPGGYGGYDLYYSKFENGDWTEPLNFGDKINSEYDEFRPVAVNVFEFKNDLMIFSSNRPGGLGGYDLYYVGIDKIMDN